MDLSIQFLSDYGHKVKLNNKEILCYSKDQLKEKYPENNFVLIGETKSLEEESKQNRDAISARYSSSIILSVDKYRKNSRLFYKEAGFLSTGKNCYIAVLKSRIPFWLHLFSGIIFLGVLLLLLLLPREAPPDPPRPPDTDPYIQTIPPPVTEPSPDTTDPPDTDYPPTTDTPDTDASGGGSVSMTYVLIAKTSLSTKEVGIYFANPQKSTHDVVLELYIKRGEEALLLAKSGLIPKGNSLLKMTAEEETLNRLLLGDYEGYFNVICYDSETGKEALVQPQISGVTVTVIQ